MKVTATHKPKPLDRHTYTFIDMNTGEFKTGSTGDVQRRAYEHPHEKNGVKNIDAMVIMMDSCLEGPKIEEQLGMPGCLNKQKASYYNDSRKYPVKETEQILAAYDAAIPIVEEYTYHGLHTIAIIDRKARAFYFTGGRMSVNECLHAVKTGIVKPATTRATPTKLSTI